MASLNVLDIAKMNGSDKVVGLIEDVLTLAPEVANFPARTIRGTSYRTLVRSALPSVEFRKAGEGVAASKSTFVNRTVETFIVDAQIRVDKAIADSYEDGPQAYQAIEASGVMASTLKLLGSQIWYGIGTGGDADGFPGAIAVYDTTNMVVDAGGTTASTGSSVWGVKFGPQFASLVLGMNGVLDLSQFATQQVTDANSNLYTAYTAALTAYPGLQIGNSYAIGRIKKLTADSGKTLTDAMIAQLLEKFQANLGMAPDALFMTPRSQRQLRDARTATNPTGQPAPFPSEAFGVPIIVTNQILNTESLTL
jgi:hypothetical protein